MILVLGPEDDVSPIPFGASGVAKQVVEVARGKEDDRTKHSLLEAQRLQQAQGFEVGLAGILGGQAMADVRRQCRYRVRRSVLRTACPCSLTTQSSNTIASIS